jgi:uncharacterized protein YidB (DUF937 family)
MSSRSRVSLKRDTLFRNAPCRPASRDANVRFSGDFARAARGMRRACTVRVEREAVAGPSHNNRRRPTSPGTPTPYLLVVGSDTVYVGHAARSSGRVPGGSACVVFDGVLGGIVGGAMATAMNQILDKHGGLQGVVNQFERNGLGATVQSWVGTGANQPISSDAVQRVLGDDLLQQLAARSGMSLPELTGNWRRCCPRRWTNSRPTASSQKPSATRRPYQKGSCGGNLSRCLGYLAFPLRSSCRVRQAWVQFDSIDITRANVRANRMPGNAAHRLGIVHAGKVQSLALGRQPFAAGVRSG